MNSQTRWSKIDRLSIPVRIHLGANDKKTVVMDLKPTFDEEICNSKGKLLECSQHEFGIPDLIMA